MYIYTVIRVICLIEKHQQKLYEQSICRDTLYVIQLIYVIISRRGFVQPTKTAIKGNFFFKFMDFVCLLFSCYCSLTALGTLVSCSFIHLVPIYSVYAWFPVLYSLCFPMW